MESGGRECGAALHSRAPGSYIAAMAPNPAQSIDIAGFVAGLPKCELHLHLEGTLSPDLKLRLAERNNIDIGQTTVAEVEASYGFDSLASFLAVYYPAMDVLVTAE